MPRTIRFHLDENCDPRIAAGLALHGVANLTSDTLVPEVKKARGKTQPLSVIGLKTLKDEHLRSLIPLQALAADARRLEDEIAGLVNAAYGLTAEEIALMWQTVPPRMPCEPPKSETSLARALL